MKTVIVLLMAGVGQRTNLPYPKQFFLFQNQPLYLYCLQTFFNCQENYDELVLVVQEERKIQIQNDLKRFHLNCHKLSFCNGGKSREISLLNACNYLKQKYKEEKIKILSHDIARVFVSSPLIQKHLTFALPEKTVYNTLLASNDSLFKKEKNQFCSINRQEIYRIQTPQTFWLHDFLYLMQNHEQEWLQLHDVATFYLNHQWKHEFTVGEINNFKITTANDLDFLKEINSLMLKNLKKKWK